MDFKQAYDHYRDGTACEEERRFVEEEIEKYQLIAEHLDAEWDTPEVLDTPQKDMKKVRRNLRKRSTATVLTCFLLAAALIFSAMGVERLFWNPEENTYDIEYHTDLEFTLAAYAELFCPEVNIAGISSSRTGFATYQIAVQHWNSAKGGDTSSTYGTIERNKLTLPVDLLRTCPVNIFENACYPVYIMDEEFKQDTAEKLSNLPDYIQVKAAVSFSEDMDMEQLLEFESQLEDAYLVWVGIRNCPEDEQRFPLSGIAPFIGGIVKEGLNAHYPNFDVSRPDLTGTDLETHFKSLLQYSKDQAARGRGLSADFWNGSGYYNDVLDYVEENGIYTYGAFIVGPPQLFLDLMDKGIASQVWPTDGWLNIS